MYLCLFLCHNFVINLMLRLRLPFAKWPGITHTKLVKYLAKYSYYTIWKSIIFEYFIKKT